MTNLEMYDRAHGITRDASSIASTISPVGGWWNAGLDPMPIYSIGGVLYCCEVVNRFEQYLLNTAEEAVAFMQRLDSPNAKILLDTFHMNIEEDDMVEAIRTAGPYLGHFHTGENNRRTPGTGKLPWKEMAQALKDIHYEGALVMEPFVLTTAHNVKRIRVWRDLSGAANVDKLVSDAFIGGQFLRKLLAEQQ